MYSREIAFDPNTKRWFSYYFSDKGNKFVIDKQTGKRNTLINNFKHRKTNYDINLKSDYSHSAVYPIVKAQNIISRRIKKIKSEEELRTIKSLSKKTPQKYKSTEIKQLQKKLKVRTKEYVKFTVDYTVFKKNRKSRGYSTVFYFSHASHTKIKKVTQQLAKKIKKYLLSFRIVIEGYEIEIVVNYKTANNKNALESFFLEEIDSFFEEVDWMQIREFIIIKGVM